MPVAHRSFLQCVKQCGLKTLGAVFRESDFLRNFVGFQKSDTPDFFAEHVGVLRDAFNRRLSELVPKALRHTADNFVLVQEQHCFAAVTRFLPTSQKSFHLAGGETFDFYFAELVRIVVENVGGCITKSFHDAFGNLLPHAWELTACQVFKDIVIVCGEVFKRSRLELLSVFRMRTPVAFYSYGFAGLQCWECSRDDNNFLAFDIVQAHHGKAILLAMERDGFYAAFDDHNNCHARFNRASPLFVVDCSCID